MAATKIKRYVRRAQLHRRPTTDKTPQNNKPYRKVVQFPQAKGKLVEDVEFSTSVDYHNISINFQDKTSLNFSIETGFTLETDYSNWRSGNQRVLRVWRPIHSRA